MPSSSQTNPQKTALTRKGAIFLSAHFCIWPVIGSAFCQTWPQQLACRLLMGIGMGVKASTVPIYAAENSPAAIRGALVMSWRELTLTTAASPHPLLTMTRNVDCIWHPPRRRFQLGCLERKAQLAVDDRSSVHSGGATAIAHLPLSRVSPLAHKEKQVSRSLELHGYVETPQAPGGPRHPSHLLWYAVSPKRSLYSQCPLTNNAELELESELSRNSSYGRRFGELFTIPRIRRATLAGMSALVTQP